MSRQIALKYVLPIAAVALLILLAAWAFQLPPVSAITGRDAPAAATNTAFPPEQPAGYRYDVINVSGTGKATKAPDVATLSLGVSVTSPSVTVARTQAAASMDLIMTALKDNGVADSDIQTTHFSVREEWEWNGDRNVFAGYEVINEVSAKVRAIDNVATVMDAAITAGGDDARFNGLSFGFSDATRADLEEKARKAAVADMQSKALQLAQSSHRQRGKLQVISEIAIGDVAAPIAEAAGLARAFADAPTPISVGENDVTVTVTGVYELR